MASNNQYVEIRNSEDLKEKIEKFLIENNWLTPYRIILKDGDESVGGPDRKIEILFTNRMKAH